MTKHDYGVQIIADSVNPVGNRITTFECTYPRMIHSEVMTHRLFSRNAASSRAIPVKKLMERIRDNPVIPKWWGKNQKGMSAQEELSGRELEEVRAHWIAARDDALYHAKMMMTRGLHKQIANRILEPWMFITTIITATEFDNFFYLRDNWPEGEPPGEAQPEIAWLAREMKKLYDASEPEQLKKGWWHLPYVSTDPDSHLHVSSQDVIDAIKEMDADIEKYYDDIFQPLVAISVARCARVSYLTHDGKRDLLKDFQLHHRLRTNGHWSPFEHAAQALDEPARMGNFIGWKQYRKFFSDEHHGREMP